MSNEIIVPSIIHLYEGTDSSELNSEEIAVFLREYFPQSVIKVREDFFRYWFQRCEKKEKRAMMVAERLARAKVLQPNNRRINLNPSPGEISFERKFLAAGGVKPTGMLYGGYKLIAIYSEMLTPDEVDLDYCHIVLTNQRFGTWDEKERRYHTRASLYGYPSFISTTGMMRGLAKSRGHYLERSTVTNDGEATKRLNEKSLVYRGSGLQEIIKGYLLRVLCYHITGDPLCNDKEYCLFNIRWREEAIHPRLLPEADLCNYHCQTLERMLCV